MQKQVNALLEKQALLEKKLQTEQQNPMITTEGHRIKEEFLQAMMEPEIIEVLPQFNLSEEIVQGLPHSCFLCPYQSTSLKNYKTHCKTQKHLAKLQEFVEQSAQQPSNEIPGSQPTI
jgi:hypothetical protein